MAVAVVAGCGPSATATSPAQPSLSATWDLHIENGTTRAVTILVDGATVATVPAGQSASIAESTLPAGVWSVLAILSGGKTVLKAQIDRSAASSGSGGRVDLSCGRLDV